MHIVSPCPKSRQSPSSSLSSVSFFDIYVIQANLISTRLKTFTQREGNIRLSEDDGPPAREFLEDDYDDDIEGLSGDNSDDESLAHHTGHNTRQTNTSSTGDAGEGRVGVH